MNPIAQAALQALAALSIACGTAGVAAQMPPAGGHVTRAVQEFTQRVMALQRAAGAGDADRVGELLGGGFEALRAEQPAEPIPREDWLAAMRAAGIARIQVEEMAVREYGPVAVVTFVMRTEGQPQSRLVTDTWQLEGGRWHLQGRVSAPLPAEAGGRSPRKQM